MLQFMLGNRMIAAWCKRPSCYMSTESYGGSNQGAEQAKEPEHNEMTAPPKSYPLLKLLQSDLVCRTCER